MELKVTESQNYKVMKLQILPIVSPPSQDGSGLVYKGVNTLCDGSIFFDPALMDWAIEL